MVTSKEVYDCSVYCSRSLILHSDLKASLTWRQTASLAGFGASQIQPAQVQGTKRKWRDRERICFVLFLTTECWTGRIFRDITYWAL